MPVWIRSTPIDALPVSPAFSHQPHRTMASREPLSDDAIATALMDLDGWTHEDDKLKKTFEFTDFRAAISFIVRMSFFAEAMNHHPELENVYNTVSIALTTHDAGGQVTQLDIDLATEIEGFSWV
jgi:4a-hydroxytetrahydrobiopterin dehydratase